MGRKSILVLGGYGGTGRVVCRLLLAETDANLVVAGRRVAKAEELVGRLNEEFPSKRVSALFADASDYESLVSAFQGVSMVLVASTTTEYVKEVAEAALATGIDYLDYHYPQSIVPVLNALAPAIEKAGRCFITQAGLHPGLPSVLVRYAASSFDRYERAAVSMVMNARVERSQSLYELVDAIGDYRAEIFRDGEWKEAGYRDVTRADFGHPFGVRPCYPMQLEEMRALPEMLGLEEVGVYVGGFNWFVDYVVFPLAMLLFKIKRGLGREFVGDLLAWGINTFAGARQGVCVVLEAEGEKEGRPLRLRLMVEHDDPYELTAIPIVASLHQYLDASIAKPGLWMMGHLVDPVRLMNDMDRMGVRVSTQVTERAGR